MATAKTTIITASSKPACKISDCDPAENTSENHWSTDISLHVK